MNRDIYQSLIKWKNSARRKPLILRGARQTGKTWLLKEFGKKEYENLFYFNFEEDPFLADVFSQGLNPHKIIEKLSLIQKQTILPEKNLIFFDEIQISNNALNSLKYFCEDAPEYHIVAAGSLLGIKMTKPLSFPVGKVSVFDLYPMTFGEFLDAAGETHYRATLKEQSFLEPIPEKIHAALIDLLKTYYFVGGMPEPVAAYLAGNPLHEVREIHLELLKTYTLDYSKHAPATDVPKITMIWEAIPAQLARENKKFKFSSVEKNARSREYEHAVQWLIDTGLVLQSLCVKKIEHPLTGFADSNSFKLYSLDIGLLGAMARVPEDMVSQGHALFQTWYGAFVESYAAQQITPLLDQKLHYWRSETHQAEVDFVITKDMDIYPLEVKAGVNPKSKSLLSYYNRFHPNLLLRTTLLNLKHNGNIINIPLYAIENILHYIQLGLKHKQPMLE